MRIRKLFQLGSAAVLSLSSLMLIAAPPVLAASPVINQFNLPSGSTPQLITTDSTGNIWFTKQNTDQIDKLPAGSTASTTPIAYSLPSSSGPEDITTDSTGNIWFTEETSNQIGELTAATIAANPAGSTTTTLANQFSLPGSTKPQYITTDSTGNIWFTEETSNQIGELTAATIAANPAGSTTTTLANQFSLPGSSSPLGIAIDSSGNVWVAENGIGQLAELTAATIAANPAGSTTTTLAAQFNLSGTATGPNAIAIDSSGDIWIAETQVGQIAELTVATIAANPTGNTTPSLTLTTNYSLPSLGPSSSIAVDSAGNIWFTEETSNHIGELTAATIAAHPTGSTDTSLAAQYSMPGSSGTFGIVADPSNNIWFTEQISSGYVGEIVASSLASSGSAGSSGSSITPQAPKTPDTGLALVTAHPLPALAVSTIATIALIAAARRLRPAIKG